MDGRIYRILIYLFAGILAVFCLLILVNYVGSRTGVPSDLPGQAQDDNKPGGASAMAEQALAAARYAASNSARASMIPSSRPGLSTAAVNSDGAINVVRLKDFDGVAEKPKDMMSMLNQMGGDRRKPAPVRLSEADLRKKIRSLGGEPDREPRLRISTMPEMGRGAGDEGVTMLSAPVDYKIFKSSDTWWAFANSRKLTAGPHDFAAADLLILISVSDFPSGIFSVAAVEKSRKETVVKYRVNPLAMAFEMPKDQREAYAAAAVPKGKPVRLEQVP